jgi:hypothetical protein
MMKFSCVCLQSHKALHNVIRHYQLPEDRGFFLFVQNTFLQHPAILNQAEYPTYSNKQNVLDAVLRKGVTSYYGILEIKIAAPPNDSGSHGDHRRSGDPAVMGDLRLEPILAVG